MRILLFVLVVLGFGYDAFAFCEVNDFPCMREELQERIEHQQFEDRLSELEDDCGTDSECEAAAEDLCDRGYTIWCRALDLERGE